MTAINEITRGSVWVHSETGIVRYVTGIDEIMLNAARLNPRTGKIIGPTDPYARWFWEAQIESGELVRFKGIGNE